MLEGSPLEPPFEIESVAAKHRFLWSGHGARRVPVARSGKLETVLVTIRTPTWTTLDALQIRLQCHVAWMRASGGGQAMRSCPFGVGGATAEVRTGYGQRFTIAIRAEDERVALEVWRRTKPLAGPSLDHPGEGEPEME